MKIFAWFLIILLLCLGVSQVMLADSGYVLIAFNGMTYESSLWAFLLLLLLSAAGVLIGWALVALLTGSIGVVYPLTRHSKLARARRLTVVGLNYLVNGQWHKAQRRLAQAADDGEAPLLNYLAAARAAQETGDDEAARDYLQKADRSTPNAGLAIGIAHAQLLLGRNKLEQALATLKELHRKAPKHTYVLKLLQQVYIKLPDWRALADLLPKLKRYKVVDDAELKKLQTRAYGEMLEQAYQQGRHLTDLDKKVQSAREIWQDLSSSQRRDNELVYAYVVCLRKLGADVEAEGILRYSLKNAYDRPLVRLYGLVEGKDINRQLLTLEALLKERPNDAELLLALGRVSLRNKLWGKAREYFEASIGQSPSIDAYNEIGRLLAHLGEHERSTEYFRQGLRMAADELPNLPMPDRVDLQHDSRSILSH